MLRVFTREYTRHIQPFRLVNGGIKRGGAIAWENVQGPVS